MFESNTIEHFPQDANYTLQKVLPLAVIKAKNTETVCIRKKCQYKNEQQSILHTAKLNVQLIVDINEDDDNNVNKSLHLNQVSCIHNSESYCITRKRHQYEQNSEINCVEKRRRYHQNIEKNRAKQVERYHKNREKNRAKQVEQYHKNREKNRANKKYCYNQKLEHNRIQKQYRYKKDLVKQRKQKQKRYLINSQCERERQMQYSDRKWLYNKRHYNKKLKSNAIEKNIGQSIIKKYEKFWSKNYIHMRNPVTITDIMNKLDIKNNIERRLEAERILRWSMHIRNNYIHNMYKILAVLKKKAEVHLTLVTECLTIDDKLHALCGISGHTASSENYFIDSTYSEQFTSSQPLITNVKGQIINVLPLVEAQAKKAWLCNTLCKINSLVIDRYKKFLEAINTCTLKKIPELLRKVCQKCTVNDLTDKLGHTQACYINPNLCKAMSLSIQLLSPHFPKVRFIKRLIYRIRADYRKLINLEKALNSGDIDTLNELIILAQDRANMYKHHQSLTDLSDDDIISKYSKAFKALTKRSMDTPRYVCVSCERLCYKRSVSEISKVKTQLDIPIWRDLMAHIKKLNIDLQYICLYCQRKFRNGLMPAYCILNNLFIQNVPEVISSLNSFEKMLIQRAKAFQTVVKMGTVMNKRLPHRQMVQKVKGRTFHLPLPLEQTMNKICSKTDAINKNNMELYILVRGIPTKAKIIWEEMVNLKKVFDALVWLKRNNHLYKHIILPDTCDGLCSEKNVEFFEVKETENDTDFVSDNDDNDGILLNSKIEMQETKNNAEAIVLNLQGDAMLTQVTDDKESYYEQYTIYPLYEKKTRESANALYQMLKIEELPLDNREKFLDLLCFPDLYPFGVNGQHETRQIKLHEHEYIKCRLTSKHPQYRLNQQYLFYLLNNANNRQLKRGIYQKLNVTNLRDRYTALEYLQAVQKDLLESDLSTIFSTLRNTAQYWRRPRYDLECMIQHYGPATWFLTLSPSEWMWDDLGQYIREVNGWCNDSSSTSALVARDPVSASRFLDNKFRAMIDFICSEDHPIGEVTHYFWRREYQGRGIQHFHMLIWIKDAPIIGVSSEKEISEFILQHVTCKMPDKNISPLLYERVNTYQQHKHNNYCLRSKKMGRKVGRICRFGFPRPVTDTLCLRDVVSSIAGRKQLKSRSRLYDIPRTEREGYINDYNPPTLTAWNGNMDIQYIGENSRFINMYISKYVSKAGQCELSEDILDCKNQTNKSIASCLWNIGLRFLNNRECGALEAADTLLGISLYGTDRDTTFKWLDTNQIRYRRVKNVKEVEALDGDSTDIFCASVIDDHYPHRPKKLESMCLYEFMQWYDITKIKPQSKKIKYYKLDNGYYLKRRQRGHLIKHYKYDVKTRPENYFFSLLLMFQPWRKMEDLKNGCDTYAESFHKVKLHLVEALQYHEKMEELKQAYETVKELVQQQIDEKQHLSQDDPDNPIGVQNIQAGEAMQDFKDLGGHEEEIDISEMISKLNADQKRVFDRVINTVSDKKSLLRLYVSGEGGTGKSFLIKTIKCWIKQNLNKDTAIAAPTGIAAFNINGLTVHRLLQLPVEHGSTPKYKQLADHVLKVLRADLKDVILFIIDEVSMISNLILLYIHFRLSEIFDTIDCDDGWFGRVHILLFGDLLQLPPVHEDPAFVDLSNVKVKKFLGSLNAVNLWTTLFDYDELTINMRQQGDGSYRELLSRIRIGLLTKSDCDILEKRKISFIGKSFEERLGELCNFIDNLPSDTVCLLPTCHMCDVLNNAMLSRIASKEILLIAEDEIECIPYIKKRITKVLADNDDDNSRTAGLFKRITIKIGAKIMIRRNIDASLGLINGTIATVISVVQDPSTDYVEKIKLLLPSNLEYFIERVSVKFQVMENAFVIRKQFPISLSYGITIHKAQGLSLQNVVTDIGNSVFSCGQIYVALSRVTSLDGLHLINFDPSCVIASEEAIIEYNRLKRIHKPEEQVITISKERYHKVKDTPWTLWKTITSVQQSDQKVRRSTACWILRGFQNTDKVSCYANAVLQCLFHLNIIRKQLFNSDKLDVLSILAHRYENGINNLNTYAIREYLGEYFSNCIKRDVFDFLTALCTKYDFIKDLVEHQVILTTRCKLCSNTKVTTDNNVILSIPVNNLKKKSFNLNDLLNISFSHWFELHDKSCERCEGNELLVKKEIKLTKQIVIICLSLFSLQNGSLVKVPQKFNLCAIPTSKILIAGQVYKVMNAIFHHGSCIENGHFISMCREGSYSDWIEADDVQVTKKQWPRGAKDIYILFLEKVDNK